MQVFDKKAELYDKWYESKMGSFVDEVETDLAFKLFKVKEGMKVLDVGCGTGNFSIKLASRGCGVTGIDISEDMLELAREKAEKGKFRISFFNMDAYSLKFDDDYFDGVFSMAAFEFLKEPKNALDEMLRVVKKGGQVMVGTINKSSSWGKLYLTENFQKNSVFRYADFKTLGDMKKWRDENLESFGQSLFIPPDAGEEDISIEKERELSVKGQGGFICASWIK